MISPLALYSILNFNVFCIYAYVFGMMFSPCIAVNLAKLTG